MSLTMLELTTRLPRLPPVRPVNELTLSSDVMELAEEPSLSGGVLRPESALVRSYNVVSRARIVDGLSVLE